jgi:microcystin-dependent protein
MMVIDANTGKTIVWTGGAWDDAGGVTLTASLPLHLSSINTISINPGTASGDLISWDGANWVNKQPVVQHFTASADNRQPFLAINYCIGTQGIFPSRNAAEPFLGEIDLFSFQFAPTGFAQCNGQLMSIAQNVALFALLGTQYGGNGTTNFALPDLRGRVPIHVGSNGATTYSIGQAGGVETNTLTH